MSARKDADRIAALVALIDAIQRREPQTLGDVAGAVFGWEPERVFLAIDAALARKLIARHADTHAIKSRKRGES